jgi:hypothetical protein
MILFFDLELLPRQDHNLGCHYKELVLETSHDLYHSLILGIAPCDWSFLWNMLCNISCVTLILSLIISKQRVPSSVPLLLSEEAPLIVFLVFAMLFTQDTLNSKPRSRWAVHLARGQNFSVPDHTIGCTCGIGTSAIFGDQEIFAFCKSSSHHTSGWVPTSSAKVFFQETPARYWTLAAHQNEYLPQVSWWVEGCGVLYHRPTIPYIPVVDIVTPKKNLNITRSSFQTRHTSVCPSTPVGTMRNTLHTLLRSFVSSNRRV